MSETYTYYINILEKAMNYFCNNFKNRWMKKDTFVYKSLKISNEGSKFVRAVLFRRTEKLDKLLILWSIKQINAKKKQSLVTLWTSQTLDTKWKTSTQKEKHTNNMETVNWTKAIKKCYSEIQLYILKIWKQ